MKLADLLRLVGDEPVFSSSLLNVDGLSPQQTKLQLVRWVNAGKLLQLRRGLYVFNAPYRRVEPHPFLLANRLKKGSYVSLQSALAHFGMIPEHAPVVTSVTTGRPEELSTPLGLFVFRHVRRNLFKGARSIEIAPGQSALVALPEKALLDLVYLTPRGDSSPHLESLRLQNLSALGVERLRNTARDFGSPKIDRAVRIIRGLIAAGEGEPL